MLSASPGLVNAQSQDREVTELSGREKRSTLRRALRDNESRELIRLLYQESWRISFRKARAALVTEDDTEHRFVIFPLWDILGNEQANGMIRWSNKEGEQTSASTLGREDSVGVQSRDFIETVYTPGTNGVESESILYTSSENDMSTSDYSTQVDEVETMIPGCPRQGCSGGGRDWTCNEYVEKNCTNWNLSCIAWVIGAVGISCNNPITAIVKCLLGSAVGLGPFVTGDNCNLCDNYKVSRERIGRACGPPRS